MILPKWFGYITSSFSLLYLINNLSIIKLQGALLEWVDAYAFFISTIRKFLFGWITHFFTWIHLSWISVSSNECHIFVLSIVLLSATFRAALEMSFVYHYDDNRGFLQKIFSARQEQKVVKHKLEDLSFLSVLVIGIFLILNFLPALVFPGFLGLSASFLGLIFIIFIFVLVEDDKIEFDEKGKPYLKLNKDNPASLHIPSGKAVRSQLLPVFLLFMVAIILNYTLFIKG